MVHAAVFQILPLMITMTMTTMATNRMTTPNAGALYTILGIVGLGTPGPLLLPRLLASSRDNDAEGRYKLESAKYGGQFAQRALRLQTPL